MALEATLSTTGFTGELFVSSALDGNNNALLRIASPMVPISSVVGCSAVFQQDGVVGYSSLAKPDFVLSSVDRIIFHVHRSILTKSSAGLVPPHVLQTYADGEPETISETAEVLNVILHSMYSMPCVQFIPSLPVLERALERMQTHKMDIRSYTLPLSSLYNALFIHVRLDSVKLYALAGHFDLEDLATAVSSHLLSIDLFSLTDTDFQRMGSVYTNKLFMLQLNRRKALKTILLGPPSRDERAPLCSVHGQEKIQDAWAQSASIFAWDARVHATPPSIIESTFEKTAEALQCQECRHCLEVRIADVVLQWSKVKRTI